MRGLVFKALRRGIGRRTRPHRSGRGGQGTTSELETGRRTRGARAKNIGPTPYDSYGGGWVWPRARDGTTPHCDLRDCRSSMFRARRWKTSWASWQTGDINGRDTALPPSATASGLLLATTWDSTTMYQQAQAMMALKRCRASALASLMLSAHPSSSTSEDGAVTYFSVTNSKLSGRNHESTEAPP